MEAARMRFIVKLVIVNWITRHTHSDQTVCSDYLVSGLYGVEDMALTASSIWGSTYGPENARLHFYRNFEQTGISSSWCSGYNDDGQHIQVKFPRETVVDAILIQGRKDMDQWVETYHLLYSIDGTTWTTVTSQDKQPKLFTGNSDRNIVIKTSLDPNITAVFIRINPRTWKNHISLRFDVSGCYKVTNQGRLVTFHRLPNPPSAELQNYFMYESHSTFPACSTMCKRGSTCLSFTFDVNRKLCRGFASVVSAKHERFTFEPTHYFVRNAGGISLGFRHIPNEVCYYKVNERDMDQTEAAEQCIKYQSRLFRIDSISKMEYLQNIIAGNKILRKQHYQLFVSGQYVAPQWKYSDGKEVIGSALWSPGNPDPIQGQCVILTQTGLVSEHCTGRHFSICEAFY